MMTDEELLAEKILKFRVMNDMTQKQFAEKCGVGRSSVIEAEKASPNISKKMRTKMLLFIENN